MIDLETLATSVDATIVSMAAVYFDPFDDYEEMGIKVYDLPQLNLLIDIESQPNRIINPDTIEWWSKQDQTVQNSIFGEGLERVSLENALGQLHKFVWNKANRIWAQGTTFDISMLEHAYASYSLPRPWLYWQVRDSRTILDLVQVKQPQVTHDAMDDCFRQLVAVQKVLKTLGVQKFVR
jgi:exodeoxyribonuclease VIII